jgi:hypothetical protein
MRRARNAGSAGPGPPSVDQLGHQLDVLVPRVGDEPASGGPDGGETLFAEEGADDQRAVDLWQVVRVEQVVDAEGVAELPALEGEVSRDRVEVQVGLLDLELDGGLGPAGFRGLDLLGEGQDHDAVGPRGDGRPEVQLDLAQVEPVVLGIVGAREAEPEVHERGDLRVQQVPLPGAVHRRGPHVGVRQDPFDEPTLLLGPLLVDPAGLTVLAHLLELLLEAADAFLVRLVLTLERLHSIAEALDLLLKLVVHLGGGRRQATGRERAGERAGQCCFHGLCAPWRDDAHASRAHSSVRNAIRLSSDDAEHGWAADRAGVSGPALGRQPAVEGRHPSRRSGPESRTAPDDQVLGRSVRALGAVPVVRRTRRAR